MVPTSLMISWKLGIASRCVITLSSSARTLAQSASILVTQGN
jgi:hypothetical protein